jgi:hypothetical protein
MKIITTFLEYLKESMAAKDATAWVLNAAERAKDSFSAIHHIEVYHNAQNPKVYQLQVFLNATDKGWDVRDLYVLTLSDEGDAMFTIYGYKSPIQHTTPGVFNFRYTGSDLDEALSQIAAIGAKEHNIA